MRPLPPGARRPRAAVAIVLAAALALLAGVALAMRGADEPPQVGLFTSLPILWNETPDIAAMLRPQHTPHWARAVLGRHGEIVALDTLESMDGFDRLVLAQPRPLGPAENLALDRWVRAGGKLLLLADPALTEPSAYALGDRRRPQDIVMLSPILTRWGLALEFDDEQPPIERRPEIMGVAVPVVLPGNLRPVGPNCRLWGDGVAASCGIGKGRVIVLADASVLERADPDDARANAFDWLLTSAFTAR